MLINGFDAIRSINSSDNNVKFESKLTEKLYRMHSNKKLFKFGFNKGSPPLIVILRTKVSQVKIHKRDLT